jgi:ABC-type Zn uptake system ZnuABC Zn-binding protein ZnuA
MDNTDLLFLGSTRLNILDPTFPRDDINNNNRCGRTEAEKANVEKVLGIISDLRYLVRINVLEAAVELQDHHLELILTLLKELIDNNLDGLNELQRATYNTVEQNLIEYIYELETSSTDYYAILDDIAVDTTVLLAGIHYWMHKTWI